MKQNELIALCAAVAGLVFWGMVAFALAHFAVKYW